MIETIFSFIALMFLLLSLAWLAVDAASFLAYVIDPLVRVFQRVFLGIDEPRAGPEAMIGKNAQIEKSFAKLDDAGSAQGYVSIDGESWQARSDASLNKLVAGGKVRIKEMDGLVLLVDPCEVEA